ncbi:hypothetical protein WJX72_002179 [[Myrmecia] bisecta]|uniref:UDENN domain-containing protein n=1 Tax=[Myrmecia] bisecta TaxID=41462 RepID=A0AAW1PP30_9CHLO
MSDRFIDYFVVCGLGWEGVCSIQSGDDGYAGPDVKYKPSLVDRLPHTDRAHHLPPQLPMCCLPAGVSIIPANSPPNAAHDLRPLCYPIVLTEGNGTKMYASCLAFYDPVPGELCAQYPALAGARATKCICLVSYWPFFKTYQKILTELHSVCFRTGSTRPVVDIIQYLLYKVPLPSPGGPQVLLTVENQLMCVERPPPGRAFDAEMSFRPLVQCLDVETLMCLFEAVLLEKRVLLLASQYSLLTAVAECICQLLYPLKWQHVYIPVMPYSLVEYMEAPTPYLMGLHSAVALDYMPDGVVVVDLDKNAIIRRDVLPPLVQPEGALLKQHIRRLLQPTVVAMDVVADDSPLQASCNMLQGTRWGPAHDAELSRAFMDFFRSVLHGAEAYVRPTGGTGKHQSPFDAAGFLKFRRQHHQFTDGDWMLSQFLDTQAFLAHMEDSAQGSLGPAWHDNQSDSLLLSDSFNATPHRIQTEMLCINPYPAPGLVGNQARFKYDEFPSLRGSFIAHPPPPAASPTKAATASKAPASPLVTRNVSNLTLSPTKPSKAAGAGKGSKRLSLELGPRSASATLAASSSAREAVLQNMKDGTLSFDSLKSDPNSPNRRSQDVRKPWEAELIFKQRAALSGLLHSTTPGAAFKPADLQRISALLAIQSGGGSWELMHLLQQDVAALRLGQAALPAGQFDALCAMLLAILRHAAAKEDFRTLLMALRAGSCLYAKAPEVHTKEYILNRLASRPLWFNSWLWEGAFSCAMAESVAQAGSSTTMKLATLVLHCLADFAAFMSAVGIPADQAWEQLVGMASQDGRAQLIGPEEMQCLHGRLTQLAEVETTRRQLTGQQALGSCHDPIGLQPVGSAHTSAPSTSSRQQPGLESCSYRLGPHSCANAVLPLTQPQALQWQCAHTKPVLAVDASAGMAASTSQDGFMRFWRTGDMALRQHSQVALAKTKPVCVSLTGDGHKCALGSHGGSVSVYDTRTAKLLFKHKGHKAEVTHLAAGSSALYMLSAGADGVAKLWDMRDPKAEALTLAGQATPIMAMDFQGIGTPVATGSRDATCAVWDMRQVAAPVWTACGHTDWVAAVKVTGSGSSGRLISGSHDCSARVWDLGSGACEAVLTGHSGAVTALESVCNGDQAQVVTGSADGSLRSMAKLHVHCSALVTAALFAQVPCERRR